MPRHGDDDHSRHGFLTLNPNTATIFLAQSAGYITSWPWAKSMRLMLGHLVTKLSNSPEILDAEINGAENSKPSCYYYYWRRRTVDDRSYEICPLATLSIYHHFCLPVLPANAYNEYLIKISPRDSFSKRKMLWRREAAKSLNLIGQLKMFCCCCCRHMCNSFNGRTLADARQETSISSFVYCAIRRLMEDEKNFCTLIYWTL